MSRASSNSPLACRIRVAKAAASCFDARSIRTDINAIWWTSNRPARLLGPISSWSTVNRRSTIAASSAGKATPAPVSPCLTALARDRAFPSAVFGPDDFLAFSRFEATFAALAPIVNSPRSQRSSKQFKKWKARTAHRPLLSLSRGVA